VTTEPIRVSPARFRAAIEQAHPGKDVRDIRDAMVEASEAFSKEGVVTVNPGNPVHDILAARPRKSSLRGGNARRGSMSLDPLEPVVKAIQSAFRPGGKADAASHKVAAGIGHLVKSMSTLSVRAAHSPAWRPFKFAMDNMVDRTVELKNELATPFIDKANKLGLSTAEANAAYKAAADTRVLGQTSPAEAALSPKQKQYVDAMRQSFKQVRDIIIDKAKQSANIPDDQKTPVQRAFETMAGPLYNSPADFVSLFRPSGEYIVRATSPNGEAYTTFVKTPREYNAVHADLASQGYSVEPIAKKSAFATKEKGSIDTAALSESLIQGGMHPDDAANVVRMVAEAAVPPGAKGHLTKAKLKQGYGTDDASADMERYLGSFARLIAQTEHGPAVQESMVGLGPEAKDVMAAHTNSLPAFHRNFGSAVSVAGLAGNVQTLASNIIGTVYTPIRLAQLGAGKEAGRSFARNVANITELFARKGLDALRHGMSSSNSELTPIIIKRVSGKDQALADTLTTLFKRDRLSPDKETAAEESSTSKATRNLFAAMRWIDQASKLSTAVEAHKMAVENANRPEFWKRLEDRGYSDPSHTPLSVAEWALGYIHGPVHAYEQSPLLRGQMSSDPSGILPQAGLLARPMMQWTVHQLGAITSDARAAYAQIARGMKDKGAAGALKAASGPAASAAIAGMLFGGLGAIPGANQLLDELRSPEDTLADRNSALRSFLRWGVFSAAMHGTPAGDAASSLSARASLSVPVLPTPSVSAVVRASKAAANVASTMKETGLQTPERLIDQAMSATSATQRLRDAYNIATGRGKRAGSGDVIPGLTADEMAANKGGNALAAATGFAPIGQNTLVGKPVSATTAQLANQDIREKKRAGKDAMHAYLGRIVDGLELNRDISSDIDNVITRYTDDVNAGRATFTLSSDSLMNAIKMEYARRKLGLANVLQAVESLPVEDRMPAYVTWQYLTAE
jgi:hypothetical protein